MRRSSARKGSLALEAALSLPGFVLAALVMLHGILALEAGLCVEMALERLGRAVPLAAVACDLLGADRPAEALKKELAEELGSDELATWIGIEAMHAMETLFLPAVAESLLPYLFDGAFEALHDGSSEASRAIVGEGPARWRMTCESRLADERLRITVRYRVRSPLGPVEQHRSFSVPFWTSGDGTRESVDVQNVWDLGNLERGRTIRTRFGANLPLGYPVLASYRNGVATAIHSMDLSPSGWEDPSGAEAALSDWIDALAAFEGTAVPWGQDDIWIPSGSIRSRRLLLVVPLNLDTARSAPILERARIEAEGRGIVLSIVRYQECRPPVAGE